MKKNLKSTLTLSALQVKNIYSQTELSGGSPPFFNRCFDKNRIKLLVSWSLKNCGQKITIDLIENLKNLGFKYATEAGISLGIDDLRIPSTKNILLVTAEKNLKKTNINSKQEYLTGIEKFQHLIDTWHKTSEILKQDVIANFQLTDVFNPVYMMAFSGARGNVSQVRQLVGMRGLMSDPQGQILDFPIKSNFREGITLTEYIISCYGARKGLVDTALKTANSGYLTRRLVDVCHHIIVCDLDCKTKRGVFIGDIFENRKIIVPLQNRLIGRILAEDIYGDSHFSIKMHPQVEKEENVLQIKLALFFSLVAKDNSGQHVKNKPDFSAPSILTNVQLNYATFDLGYGVNEKQFLLFLNTLLRYKPKLIAKRNQEISVDLAKKIARLKNSVFVRSPLTCKIKNSICQLCYGWSLAHGKLVSLGEAVGVVAAQSIGEPGTQLTMRTFHTGGVFSGDVMNEIVAPFSGKIVFDDFFPGMLIRTPHGKIAFLTKAAGSFKLAGNFLDSVEPRLKREKSMIFKIPALCVLFVRNQEYVTKGQSLAEFSLMEADANERIQASHDLNSEIEGEVLFKSLLLLTLIDGKTNKVISRTTYRLGCIWILAGKICMQSVPIALFSQPGDLVDKSSILAQYETMSSHSGFISKHEVHSGKNINSVGHLTQPYNPPYSSGVQSIKRDALIFHDKNSPKIPPYLVKQTKQPPILYNQKRPIKSWLQYSLLSYSIESFQYKGIGYFFALFLEKQVKASNKEPVSGKIGLTLTEDWGTKPPFPGRFVPSEASPFGALSLNGKNRRFFLPRLGASEAASPLPPFRGARVRRFARPYNPVGQTLCRSEARVGKNEVFSKPCSLPYPPEGGVTPRTTNNKNGFFQGGGPTDRRGSVRKTFDFSTSNLLDHLKIKNLQLDSHKCFLGNSRNHEFKNSRSLNKNFFFKIFPQQYETQTGGQLIYDNFYLKKKTGEIFWMPQETYFLRVSNCSKNFRNYLTKIPKNNRFLAKQGLEKTKFFPSLAASLTPPKGGLPREKSIYLTQKFFSRSSLKKSKIFLGSRKPHPKQENLPVRNLPSQFKFFTTNQVPKRIKFYALHKIKSNLSIPLPTQRKRCEVFCYTENTTHKKQEQFFLSGSFPVPAKVQDKKYGWKNVSNKNKKKILTLQKTKQNHKKVTRTRNPLFIFGLSFLLGTKIRNKSFFLDFDKNGPQNKKISSISVSKNLIHKIKLFKAHNVSYKINKNFQNSKIYSFYYKFYQIHFNVNPLAKFSNTSQFPLDGKLDRSSRSKFAQLGNLTNSSKREKLEQGSVGRPCQEAASLALAKQVRRSCEPPVLGKVARLSWSCFAKEIFFSDRKNICSEKSLNFSTVKKNSTIDIKLLTKQRLTFLQPHFPWKIFIENHKKIKKNFGLNRTLPQMESCFFFNEKEKKVLYHLYLNSLIKDRSADFSSRGSTDLGFMQSIKRRVGKTSWVKNLRFFLPQSTDLGFMQSIKRRVGPTSFEGANKSKKSKIFFPAGKTGQTKRINLVKSPLLCKVKGKNLIVSKRQLASKALFWAFCGGLARKAAWFAPPLGEAARLARRLSSEARVGKNEVFSKPWSLPYPPEGGVTPRGFLNLGFMQSINFRAKRENQLKDFLVKANLVPNKSETNWKGTKRQLNHLKMSNTKQQPTKQVEKRKLENSSSIKTKIKAGWMYLPSLGQIKNRQANSLLELASKPSEATLLTYPKGAEWGLSNNSLEQVQPVLWQAGGTSNRKTNEISTISGPHVYKKHDKVIKPGVICFDTILFDQYPVYCQCISMSEISLSDNKYLKKKNIDLAKFKDLLKEFQYTKRSSAGCFFENSLCPIGLEKTKFFPSLEKQEQNNKSIASSNNNDQRFAEAANFRRKLAGSDNSLYLQVSTVKKWFFNIFSLKLRSSLLFQSRFAIYQLYRTKKIYKNRFNLVIKRILVKTILTENSFTHNLEKIYFLKNTNFTIFRCTLPESDSSYQGPLLSRFSFKHLGPARGRFAREVVPTLSFMQGIKPRQTSCPYPPSRGVRVKKIEDFLRLQGLPLSFLLSIKPRLGVGTTSPQGGKNFVFSNPMGQTSWPCFDRKDASLTSKKQSFLKKNFFCRGVVEPHSRWFAQATWVRSFCEPTFQSEKPSFLAPSGLIFQPALEGGLTDPHAALGGYRGASLAASPLPPFRGAREKSTIFLDKVGRPYEVGSQKLRTTQTKANFMPWRSSPKKLRKVRRSRELASLEKPQPGRCYSVPNYSAKQKNRQVTPLYPPIFLMISKIKSYSFQTVTQYKKLLAQQNKVPTGDVTSFISSPLGPLRGRYDLSKRGVTSLRTLYRTQQKTKKPLSGNFLLHSVLKLRLINKQNSTHLFRHYPSPDFYLKFFFKFPFYPRTFGENESNGLIKNTFSKKTSIVQYNIIFIIPKNYKSTTTKIYFPGKTKQRFFGIENISLQDPYSKFYVHQLTGKTYSNLSASFNVSIFTELETVSLAKQGLEKTKFFPSLAASLTPPKGGLPRERPRRPVAVANFTPKHLSNDNETLTKIFYCSQNHISLEMPMNYTNLLSRHYGEILYSGFDRNKDNSNVKKKNRDSALLLYTTEKQKYLTLTSDEQSTFAIENSDSKLEVPFSCQNKPEKQRNTKSRYTLGDRISYGAKLSGNLVIPASGVIIQIKKSRITIRKAQPLSFSAKGLVSVYQGDIIEKNTLIMRLFYQRLKTGDIVQGIPRIEQLFEARKTNQGELLSGSLHEQLEKIFLYYLDTYNFSKAARYSLEKIQQIIVSSVQKVYRSQGVIIADKHLEIIIRQMTSKVEVIESGQTSLLPGEIVDLDWIEVVNKGMNDENTKAKYVPIILGITRKSLETKSFISEASFQETTRVLTKSSIERRTDFLKGLKENVILGHLVPAGTGFYSNTALHKKMFPPIKPPYYETRVYESYNIFRKIFSPLVVTSEAVLDEKID